MFNSHTLRTCIWITSFLMLFSGTFKAQTTEKKIYKKYILKDSSSLNKSAVLLFYTDNTFINFGIFDNKKDLDLFVWYKSGTWKEQNEIIECQSLEKLTFGEDLKRIIKNYYKTHRDRVLIESYYEFVQERYQNGTLVIRPEYASDTDKKIDYQEIKL